MTDDHKSRDSSHFDKEFQSELSVQLDAQLAATSPKKTISADDHARMSMEDAAVEENVHHWGHVLFAIFGFAAITTALILVFVMSVAFAAGEDPANAIVRWLVNPSLALLLAYGTAISLLLGLIGLGLGEWHHRSR